MNVNKNSKDFSYSPNRHDTDKEEKYLNCSIRTPPLKGRPSDRKVAVLFPHGCPIKNQTFLMTRSSLRPIILRLPFFFLPGGAFLLLNRRMTVFRFL